MGRAQIAQMLSVGGKIFKHSIFDGLKNSNYQIP